MVSTLSEKELEKLILQTYLMILEEASRSRKAEVKAAVNDKDGNTSVQSILRFIVKDIRAREHFARFAAHR